MKIAIAGYGIEGEASYEYYSKNSQNDLVIVDQKTPKKNLPDGIKSIINDNVFENLYGFDLVVRTASLSPKKIKTDGKIWSITNEFFDKCPCPIIGVTGTKGKGTISSLLASILEAAGKKVWLVGNIGITPLQFLDKISPSDIVVYELSSFQLWDIQKSPQIAIITMIEPEHLDIHENFEDYVNAKANIRRYQKDGDYCIFHPTNEISKQIAESSNSGEIIQYGKSTSTKSVFVKDGAFFVNQEYICGVNELKLIGGHNIENACAAITAAKILNIDNQAIKEGLNNFKGLEHRLEFVREFNGVKYINDCFSSSTPATYAAIKAFDNPIILIMGGIDRGGDFRNIVNLINEKSNIKKVILIGQNKQKLAELFEVSSPKTLVEVTELKNLKEIVDLARNNAVAGDTILMSPGSASFDMFKDFYDRGKQFKEAVNNLC